MIKGIKQSAKAPVPQTRFNQPAGGICQRPSGSRAGSRGNDLPQSGNRSDDDHSQGPNRSPAVPGRQARTDSRIGLTIRDRLRKEDRPRLFLRLLGSRATQPQGGWDE